MALLTCVKRCSIPNALDSELSNKNYSKIHLMEWYTMGGLKWNKGLIIADSIKQSTGTGQPLSMKLKITRDSKEPYPTMIFFNFINLICLLQLYFGAYSEQQWWALFLELVLLLLPVSMPSCSPRVSQFLFAAAARYITWSAQSAKVLADPHLVIWT